jgi:drug/metabolite transporter (DMT)-like permease
VSQSLQLRYYAVAGVIAAVLLNLLLRTFVRLGGVFTTLLIAAAIAAGLALVFHWRQGRAPSNAERWRFTALYGSVLGLLYLGLLGMMYLQDTPSPMGLFLFSLHYLCYPVLAWLAFSPRHGR